MESKNDQMWDKRYQELVEYHKANGHCSVAQRYKHNPALGRWVSKQENEFNNANMRSDRRERLDELGIAWNNIARDTKG